MRPELDITEAGINQFISFRTVKKSLLTSLCQREEQFPSLAKRGEGRFSIQIPITYGLINIPKQ
jgi:hypothetical protein